MVLLVSARRGWFWSWLIGRVDVGVETIWFLLESSVFLFHGGDVGFLIWVSYDWLLS